MKRNFVFISLMLSAVLAGFAFVGTASAQPAPEALLVDDFLYTPGQLTDGGGGANVSGGSWVTNTGAGVFIPVSAGGLTYTGYASSGIGNKITLTATTASAEDSFRSFQARGVGTTTYAAFMVNITDATLLPLNASATGEYFAGLISSTSTSAFVSRVTIRQGATAGNYQIGLRATGNAGNVQVFSSTELPYGTTALIVISYQVVSGATNDVSNLWINPTLGGSEPTPTLTQVSAADNADTGKFFVRQGNAGGVSSPNAGIDGIRVGASWSSITSATPTDALADFNGDGKTDYAVVRPAGGGPGAALTWYISPDGVLSASPTWGIASDILTPADYDGDGKDDVAIWRQSGTPGATGFYILNSFDNSFRFQVFGQAGDDVSVVEDYTGDGHDDPACYRDGAQGVWWYFASSGPRSGSFVSTNWGTTGDVAVPGDFTGDGKADFHVQRSTPQGGPPVNTGVFYMHPGTGGTDAPGADVTTNYFGLGTDTVYPGDWDGDGRADLAILRVEGGVNVWYVLPSSGGAILVRTWGVETDIAVPGDYDGDGRMDFAVWRPSPSPSQFYVLGSSVGGYQRSWGTTTDVPVNENGH